MKKENFEYINNIKFINVGGILIIPKGTKFQIDEFGKIIFEQNDKNK